MEVCASEATIQGKDALSSRLGLDITDADKRGIRDEHFIEEEASSRSLEGQGHHTRASHGGGIIREGAFGHREC